MANREKGEVSFTVGDQTYTFKMTCEAMAQLEDACLQVRLADVLGKLNEAATAASVASTTTGDGQVEQLKQALRNIRSAQRLLRSEHEEPLQFPAIFKLVVLNGSVKYLRLYLWAALQEYHPTLTVKAVGKIIDQAGGVDGLWSLLEKVQAAATPDKEDVPDPLLAQPTTVAP